MAGRRKGFLFVAIPFGIAVIALSFVSLWASATLTGIGLAAFGTAMLRPKGRVLALSPCAFCARKIIFEHDGELCATCDKGLHGKCMDEHRMAAHAPPQDQPFR